MSGIGAQFLRGGLAGFLTVLGSDAACSGATLAPPGEEAPEALMSRAAAADHAGRTNEAVSSYEALLRRDTALEAVVAPRLVSLYVGGNQPAQALSWAARAARKQPDPKAYLAGVHAQLGQFTEAERLLQLALREARCPRARVTLLWQLADAQEGQGNRDSALATLSDARSLADDDSLKKTASQRLEALRKRIEASQPAAPQPPSGKDKQ